MANDPDLELRQLRSDDDAALKALFDACFGMDVRAEYFRWKYRENPAGDAVGFVADAGDRLGAFYGVIPEPWSVDGHDATIHQSMDTMTHPDFQRRGLFVKLANLTYDAVRNATGRCDLVGIAGPTSLPGFVNKLGWKQIHEFELLTVPAGVARVWPRRGDRAIQVEHVRRPDDGVHEVLAAAADPVGAAWPRLQGAFFDWRVFGYSPKRLQVALASRAGRPLALCVYGLTSARTTLVSYVVGVGDESPRAWFPPLLRFVAQHGTFLYTWRPQVDELTALYGSIGFRASRLAPGSLRQRLPLIVRSESNDVNGVRWTDPGSFNLQPLMQD